MAWEYWVWPRPCAPRASVRAFCDGLLTSLYTIDIIDAPSYGRRNSMSSNIMTPSAHTSDAAEYVVFISILWLKSSGAMYAGVPLSSTRMSAAASNSVSRTPSARFTSARPRDSSCCITVQLMPKSESLGVPSAVSSTLAGFTSR